MNSVFIRGLITHLARLWDTHERTRKWRQRWQTTASQIAGIRRRITALEERLDVLENTRGE